LGECEAGCVCRMKWLLCMRTENFSRTGPSLRYVNEPAKHSQSSSIVRLTDTHTEIVTGTQVDFTARFRHKPAPPQTQTVLGGLTIYLLAANFLQCTCAKNYGNWPAVDKVIAKIIWLTFFGPPCTLCLEKMSLRFSALLQQTVYFRTWCSYVAYLRS